MNRLQYETSPYLQQHAHNPVDWYPWGEEALEMARKQDKPILVSIGYSTCHWCHVMERESFEDPEVADYMNAHFVNIKIDREERPDLDQIYMEAVQVLTGSGGWPLNCFLLPDTRPFYGGTYFPPQPAYRRPSWMQLLAHLNQLFREKRSVVEEQAQKITALLEKGDDRIFSMATADLGERLQEEGVPLRAVAMQLEDQFDTEHGGFGGAPKFPSAMSLRFLLDQYYYEKWEISLEHLMFSLREMIRGGIYDQLGGGFARYATDKAWLIPHFEKMLYDNALLVGLMADTWRFTRDAELERAVRDTLGYVAREMTHPEGPFYSAQDADSEGEEGKFYVWQPGEIEALLTEQETALFKDYYQVQEGGNWEGKHILHRRESLSDFAERQGKEETEMDEVLTTARLKLFEHRAQRVRPGLDDKVLLSWNALMISAHIKAWQAFEEVGWKTTALKAMHWIEQHLQDPDSEGLLHHYKDGKARQPAFLDDYAYWIRACLQAYTLDWDEGWLEKAKHWTDHVLTHFAVSEEPLLFYTTSGQTDVVVRKKEIYDNAVPSGNAVMMGNLWQLGWIWDEADYRERAQAMLRKMKPALMRYPSAFGQWLVEAGAMEYGLGELAVVGEEAGRLGRACLQEPLLHRMVLASDGPVKEAPLLADKQAPEQGTNLYWCQNYQCQRPVQTIEALRQLIESD